MNPNTNPLETLRMDTREEGKSLRKRKKYSSQLNYFVSQLQPQQSSPAQCWRQSPDEPPPQTGLILLFYKMEQTGRFVSRILIQAGRLASPGGTRMQLNMMNLVTSAGRTPQKQ